MHNILSIFKQGSVIPIALLMIILISGLYHYKHVKHIQDLELQRNELSIQLGIIQREYADAITVNLRMEEQINRQNSRIKELSDQTNQRNQQAEQQVERIFIEREQVRVLDNQAGSKPEDMNRWLSNIFGL